MTLTYDIVSSIIVSRAYNLYHLRKQSKIWCVDSSWGGGVVHTILGHLTMRLTSDLIFSFFVSEA